MYALCDCNNFFVSCERVFRPDLWGKPVVVLSGNDGCVVARSNEVKALGIKMGTPLYQIRGLVDKHHITCFSSNFSLYGDLSARVMSILRSHTTRFEQYSIDEAFISVDHVPEPERKAFCEQIVREIGQGVGIPVSMGIAPTKTLAKVASKYAKKYPGYHGVCPIDNEERRRKALQDFPVGDVWGIGRKALVKMESAGIRTALQFADKSEEYARNLLHKPGMLTWRELNGVDSIDTSELLAKQSITTSRTVATPVTTRQLLEQQLANFCDSCARKLRGQHSVCTQAIVFARTSRFRLDLPQDAIALTVNFPVATSDTREMLGYILDAFRQRFLEGVPYKQAGVILTRIVPATSVMEDLFDPRDRQRDQRLQRSVDLIRERCGRGSVILGTQLPPAGETQPDIYRQDHHSPHYTTDITQLLRIKV